MIEGDYTVEISDKSGAIKKTIAYKALLAYVVIKQFGSKHMLTIASQTPANFNIRILDESGNELFQKIEPVKNSFGLVYKLENVEGPVTFSVTEDTGSLAVVQR